MRFVNQLLSSILVIVAGLSLGLTISAYGIYVNDDIDDPRDSSSKSGVKTPREYYLPPTPSYERVDLKEFRDYMGTAYSPYAQLQLQHPIQIGNIRLREGYYLVKLDVITTPPAPLNVSKRAASKQGNGNDPPVSVFEKVQSRAQKITQSKDKEALTEAEAQYPPQPQLAEQIEQARTSLPESNQQVCMLLKKMGEIEVVIPISGTTDGDKSAKKGSVAQLVVEPGNPLKPQIVFIKYCLRNTCYRSAPIEPGLVQ
jgi:hypothetical protein